MATLYTEFYCDPVNGNNLNGGSDPPGTSPSLNDTAGSWDGTSVYTTALSTTSVAVGQFASIYTGGTDAVYIASVASKTATTVTLSTTVKRGAAPASGAASIRVGGAWKGINGADGFPLNFMDGHDIGETQSVPYPRISLATSATYSITATVVMSGQLFTVQGMNNIPGDGGRAIIDGGTSGASYVLLQPDSVAGLARGNFLNFRDLEVRNNGATGAAHGIAYHGTGADGALFMNVVVHDILGSGIRMNAAMHIECETYNCNLSGTASTAGFHADQSGYLQGNHYIRCVSHDHSGAGGMGFWVDDNAPAPVYLDCVAANNNSDGFHVENSGPPLTMRHCVAYNNGGAGIRYWQSPAVGIIEDCVLVSNGSCGINGASTGVNAPSHAIVYFLLNNAFFNNTSGATNIASDSTVEIGHLDLTANPLTDPAHGDYSLNNVAGGGAFCRGAGRGNFTQIGTTKKTTESPSIGLQQQDTGAIALVDGGAVFQTVTSW